MSDDVASDRLRLLNILLRGQAAELQSLAGLQDVAQMIDCGNYIHHLRDRLAESSFVAYEFIEGGLDLATYMKKHHPGDGRFSGLPTAETFAQWARMLTIGVLEIHNCLALHGDICPRNVLVPPGGRPVFIDPGQSLFREVMNGAKEFSGFFYRAPEGITTPGSDLFSLGGLLYYLATGKEPIGFSDCADGVLKQQVALKIKQANLRLYQDDAGVADIIAMCLRKQGRIQHASHLLREIDTFWPETAPSSIQVELKALGAPAAILERAGNALYRFVAAAHVRSCRQLLTNLTKGVFDVSGSPDDIRRAAYALLGWLRAGDEFVTVSVPAFFFLDNIGIDDRFFRMCCNSAGQGSFVKRVFLLDEGLSDRHLQRIVAAQLRAAVDMDPALQSNFSVRYVLMPAAKRRELVADGKHFGLLVKEGDRIAMSPVYDANEVLVTLRFRSGLRQVEGLRETFESIWADANPLVDLRFPTSSLNIDVLENVG
jgi:hypothetical protein